MHQTNGLSTSRPLAAAADAKRKSVLYIGAGAPWLGGAGYLVRQRMWLRALADVADLTLAMFDLPQGSLTSPPGYARKIEPLPKVERVLQGSLARLAGDFLNASPRMLRNARPKPAQVRIAQMQPARFDAVFAFRVDFAAFAGVLSHPRLLLDIDDPEHLRWRRQLAATTRSGGDWRTLRDLKKLGRFEKRAARGAVASFVCQENDRAAFDPPPIVVPNCVDVPAACAPRKASSPRIILVGNFALTSPNLDGLYWFLDEVWPSIHRQIPECEFHVAGRLNDAAAARIRSAAGAVAAGFVDDLPAAMAAASLSIAPIRFGTGTRVKIIESFALGCPVVSTTVGYEGIAARPGADLLVADAPAAFADECVKLLRDPAAQARLGAAGYKIAATQYDEAARRPTLVTTLAELAEGCRAERT